MLHKKNVSVESYNSLTFLYFNRFKIDLFNFHSFIANISTKWNIFTKWNAQTLSGFLRIFMGLCGSKVQLALPHGIVSSGVTNPEIVYILLPFQILCIN